MGPKAGGRESWYTQYIYDVFLMMYLSIFVAVVVAIVVSPIFGTLKVLIRDLHKSYNFVIL